MARCACGTGTCSCIVKAAPDGGVTVVGNGSVSRPYLLSVPGGNPLLNLDVVDSPTLDLTISGSGTATDKRRITGAATQSLTNLKDVQGTPVEGEIPVWRTDHWEFEAAAAAGLPVSGSWGTAPLDKYGSDSKVGREIYLDVDSKLRARPEVIEMGAGVDLNTVLSTGKWTQSQSIEATLALNYPTTYAGLLEVVAVTTATPMVWQRWTNYAHATAGGFVYERGFYNGVWQPWRITGGSIHWAGYKSAAQVMATASTWYTCTFENVEASLGGIAYSNGIFTVPVAGEYAINWCSHIQNTTTTTTVNTSVLKNGVSIAETSNGAVGSNKNWSLAKTVKCEAGDTLAIRAKVNVANANMYGTSAIRYTWIDITLVGG